MKKVLLFLFLLIPVPVFADNFNIRPSDAYVYYYNVGQLQESVQGENVSGNAWWKTTSSNTNKATKVAYLYDLTNYDYDYFSIMIRTLTTSGNIAVTYDSIACENISSPQSFNNNTAKVGIFSFVCQNTRKNDFINIMSPNSESGIISIGQYIAFYNDKNSATIQTAINNQTQQQQQQNQIINNTDTSSNSNDFANTINNFAMPNGSHGFDILSGLQSFVSGLSVSSSCHRISVPVPFTNQNLVLPCMTTDVYSVHFPEIVVIWQLIVRGLVYYYIIVNILRLIKETIDPFNFKLEVMDL